MLEQLRETHNISEKLHTQLYNNMVPPPLLARACPCVCVWCLFWCSCVRCGLFMHGALPNRASPRVASEPRDFWLNERSSAHAGWGLRVGHGSICHVFLSQQQTLMQVRESKQNRADASFGAGQSFFNSTQGQSRCCTPCWRVLGCLCVCTILCSDCNTGQCVLRSSL